ncbi:MAG: fasciclin domain-containing protein [Gemmatimonadales bacterium]
MLTRSVITTLLASAWLATGCSPAPKDAAQAAPPEDAPAAGQIASSDANGPKTIAAIALGSKDHTTLVAALKAANLLDALATPGPLTVFAPVNSAFDKLPAGTVETLLKPENIGQLRTVLQHHVIVTTYKPEALTDGMSLSMLDGGPITVTRKGDDITVGGAKVLGSVPAGNGYVYVIDGVLVPGK